MEILLATNNKGKAAEFSRLSEGKIQFRTLSELNIHIDPEENAETLSGNAIIKVEEASVFTNLPVLADDSGLFIDCLNGMPGVISARFAGEKSTDADNIDKVLELLKHSENRSASFKAVLALRINHENFLFSGELKGSILKERRGEGGFGYDPIFMPDGFELSLAEIDSEIKNTISHRGKAFEEVLGFLKTFQLI